MRELQVNPYPEKTDDTGEPGTFAIRADGTPVFLVARPFAYDVANPIVSVGGEPFTYHHRDTITGRDVYVKS